MATETIALPTIEGVRAREILDSRGNPTVETEVVLRGGFVGHAQVPSGASTGRFEAVELRDNDPKRYHGKGVLTAVKHVNTEIAAAIVNSYWDSIELDRRLIQLDGSNNKANFGANAILSVSLAFAKAFAQQQKQSLIVYLQSVAAQVNNLISFKASAEQKAIVPPGQPWRMGWKAGNLQLPCPLVNIVNGGMHADNELDIQEFMIVPIGAPSFSEGLRYCVEVFQSLKTFLKQQRLSTAVGDEGGFAPQWSTTAAAIEGIMAAIKQSGFTPGKEIALALDVASSAFYQEGRYQLKGENRVYTTEEWIDQLEQWVTQYPIISIEDGLDEQDWTGWSKLTERLGHRIQLVGDDIFVTNTARLKEGVEKRAANAILIKPNQIGTLTETLGAIATAQAAGYGVVISHRSGETEDTFIADLAVATKAGQIKTGSVCRGERIAKYNQLLRIEAERLLA